MFPSAPRLRGLVLLVLPLVFASPALAVAHTEPTAPRLEWRRVVDAAPEDAPTALASDGADTLALGGSRGVRRLGVDGFPETVLRRGPVTDLAFLADGSLLIATGQGLYRVDRDGGSFQEPLTTEGAAGGVRRLDAARGLAVAATDRGVFLRDAEARWRRVHRLPLAPAALVALRDLGADLELWSVIDGDLWIAGLRPGAADPWLFARRASLPLAPDSELAVDVAFELPGAESLLVFPTRLVVRDASGIWRSLRPALPPGAFARRISHAFGRLWLATSAGLLSSPHVEGPWERAASPVGSLPVIAVQGGGGLVAATHRGVHRAAPPLPTPVLQDVAATAPALRALHLAALREQGLLAERVRSLRRRSERRGWWPELEVMVGYGEDHGRSRDYDQTFVSGDTRHLYDREHDRGSDLDLELTLSWDLGDAVFHPDELDVLRETRSVIALRDDVLDEVTQLYFERLRVLSRLELAPAVERPGLALRAAELAAGLDAWTGGAFSRDPP